MKYWEVAKDNLKISIAAIRSNMLRSILTILIIVVGITALVGILTASDSLKNAINRQLATMGSNTFTIESSGFDVIIGNKDYRRKNYAYISFRHAKEFKERFDFPATVSIQTIATGIATLKYASEKTNPNVSVIGVDENYISTAGYTVVKGRNFLPSDFKTVKNYVIIGSDIKNKLFKSDKDPINCVIKVGGAKFKVIGVLDKKGTSIGGSDNLCLIPFTGVRQQFSNPGQNYSINVSPDTRELYEYAMGYSESLFRKVRRLNVRDESDFNLTGSDFLSNILNELISKVLIATSIIGFITLFGAAIGLMNILLVSVRERTREIGIRKALGAKNINIRQQFLFEAIIICQLGGIFGILFGMLIGNIVSLLFKSAFFVPWLWILMGILFCFGVGMASGIFPAIKASKLDPIIALRYE